MDVGRLNSINKNLRLIEQFTGALPLQIRELFYVLGQVLFIRDRAHVWGEIGVGPKLSSPNHCIDKRAGSIHIH